MGLELFLYSSIFDMFSKNKNNRSKSPEWFIIDHKEHEKDFILSKSISKVLNNINNMPLSFE